MRGHLVALALASDAPADEARGLALYAALFERHRVRAPVMAFDGRLWVRVSAQIYNDIGQYERLAAVDWRKL